MDIKMNFGAVCSLDGCCPIIIRLGRDTLKSCIVKPQKSASMSLRVWQVSKVRFGAYTIYVYTRVHSRAEINVHSFKKSYNSLHWPKSQRAKWKSHLFLTLLSQPVQKGTMLIFCYQTIMCPQCVKFEKKESFFCNKASEASFANIFGAKIQV